MTALQLWSGNEGSIAVDQRLSSANIEYKLILYAFSEPASFVSLYHSHSPT